MLSDAFASIITIRFSAINPAPPAPLCLIPDYRANLLVKIRFIWESRNVPHLLVDSAESLRDVTSALERKWNGQFQHRWRLSQWLIYLTESDTKVKFDLRSNQIEVNTSNVCPARVFFYSGVHRQFKFFLGGGCCASVEETWQYLIKLNSLQFDIA